MRNTLKIGALAIAIGLSSSASAMAEQVRVGFAAEPYPPFTTLDASGKWTGWEVDFADAVCKEAKLDCVITTVSWDGIIPALVGKKIDMIIGSMSITEERQKTIDFSDKYYSNPAGIIAPKGEKLDVTPEGITGKIIGVQISTNHAAYVKKHFPEAAEIKEYLTQDEANQDLAAGRVDAVQAGAIALDAFLKTQAGGCCELKGTVKPDVEVLGPGIGIGLRKEDSALKGKLNAAIEAIRENGTYDAFSKKYFDFDIYGG